MRVLVTRPEADARRTAARLAQRGHEALVVPLLTIERTATPPPAAFDALAITSANAAPALAAMGPGMAGRPVFAVGRRTAEAVAAAGWPDIRVADASETAGGDGAALARLIASSLKTGSMVLHVAGRERKPEPQNSLVAAGFAVHVWEAYAAVAARRLPGRLHAALDRAEVDAALHFSRRSAVTLIDLASGAGLLDRLRGLGHACLSADVAAPLCDIGAARVVVACRPGEASLLDSLVRLPPARPSPSPVPQC